MASCGFILPLSKYQLVRIGAIGNVLGGKPSICHSDGASKRTIIAAGNWFQMLTPFLTPLAEYFSDLKDR